MQVNQATLTSLNRSVNTMFSKGLADGKEKAKYKRICTEVPSTSKEETYAWLGKFPKMREWLGERIIQNLMSYSYIIKNKKWEDTIGVSRDDIEDDNIGMYGPMFKMLGVSAEEHYDDLAFEILMKGFEKRCYDGQYFFDTDHRDGEGPIQSNRGSAPLNPDSYQAARVKIMNLQDEQKRSLNLVPDLLIVAPDNEATGRKILEADQIDGTSNTLKNTAELLVVPALSTKPKAWYLACTKYPLLPLILQIRRKAEFRSYFNPNDYHCFMNDEFLFGADSRDNVGYGLWQLIYGSTGDQI